MGGKTLASAIRGQVSGYRQEYESAAGEEFAQQLIEGYEQIAQQVRFRQAARGVKLGIANVVIGVGTVLFLLGMWGVGIYAVVTFVKWCWWKA